MNSTGPGEELRGQAALLLRKAFLKKKKGHRGYSLRVLANKVGLSEPFVSQLLSGKRALPIHRVEAISSELDLDAEKRDFLFRAVMGAKSTSLRRGIANGIGPDEPAKAPLSWAYQPSRSFWMLEEWHYLAILNCTLLVGYSGSPTWVADLLGLKEEFVREAFSKLAQAGFLKEENGRLIKSSLFNDFHSRAHAKTIRAFHASALKRAKQEMLSKTDEPSVEARLLNTYVLTVPAEKVPWAKQKLRAFLDEFVSELTETQGEQVYQLGIQFMPVSKSAAGK